MERWRARRASDSSSVDEHPAATGRDQLVAVEAEAADPPDRPDVASIERSADVRRPERLRRVLDDRDAVAVGGREDRLDGGRVAEEVDDLDRGRLPHPEPGAAVELLDDGARIEVQRLRLRVDEDRRRADVDDRVDGGDEGQARDEDVVARPDVEDPEREMDRRRAAGAGDRVA